MELSDDILISLYHRVLNVKKQRIAAIDDITGIDYIKEPISYEHFFREYLWPNKPCILGSWSTEKWLSRSEWVREENKPNWQLLKDKFGHAQCPVADCKQSKYDSHPKTEMTLTEYIEYIEDYRARGHPDHEDCLYLKDWHFQRTFPHYEAYTVPEFFLSDWMNEFWDKRDDVCDDYRFVYIGPKGSWTPFHTDVFKSYSWSANICGRKKWIMFAPGEEEHLKNKLGHLPFDVNSEELTDVEKYPFISNVKKRFEIYQEAGEIIFVPSGWYHQVYNMEDTISINHNWSNGCNIDLCWQHLMSSMSEVQKEISDCRDMEGWAEQCQLILKANNGIDYGEFYRFLYTVADSRINTLQKCKPCCQGDGCCQGHQECQCQGHSQAYLNHLVFDLLQIKDLVFQMKRNKEFLQVDFDTFTIRPKALIKLIDDICDDYMNKLN